MTVYVLTSVNAGVLADGSSDERVDAVLWTGALYRTRERAMLAAQADAREAYPEVGDLV